MLSKSGKELMLEKSMTLTDIQNEFSMLFPYLKLEFYTLRNSIKSSLNSSYLSKKLTDFNKRNKQDELCITPEMSVTTLEYNFHSLFDLNIQIYRKCGKSWLETSATGEWSLLEQNAEGEALGE
jgi:hypothetical protein